MHWFLAALLTAAPSPTRVLCVTTNAARVCGDPGSSDIELIASWGTATVKLNRARSLRYARSSELVTVELETGQLLTGVLKRASIAVGPAQPIGLARIVGLEMGERRGLTEGLRTHYPLKGDTLDKVGLQHGTNHGAQPAAGRSREPNGSMRFANGAYVLLPDGLVAPDAEEYTLALWLSPTRSTAFCHPLYLGASSGETWLQMKDGLISFGVHDATGQGYSIDARLNEGSTHVAAVFRNGRAIELWLNGERVAMQDIPRVRLMIAPGHQHSSAIGSYAPQQQNHMRAYGIGTFEGHLSDVRIYSRALSPIDVAELFAAR